MTTDIWALLATNLLVLLAVLSLAALPSFRTKDPSYIDWLWGLGFVVVAVVTCARTEGDKARSALLVGLTVLWAVRLSTYLFLRWRTHGPDKRYQTMFGENAPNGRLWLRVFVAQALVLWVVSLPVQLGQQYDGRLTWLNVLGAAVALTGITVEAVADAQLARFKRSNPGAVMDRGLWSWSRHPNYFGEATTWWGLGLLAVHNAPTVAALLGPLVITLLLLTRSGIGPNEAHQRGTKPGYDDYVERTSAFVPRPPRAVREGDRG